MGQVYTERLKGGRFPRSSSMCISKGTDSLRMSTSHYHIKICVLSACTYITGKLCCPSRIKVEMSASLRFMPSWSEFSIQAPLARFCCSVLYCFLADINYSAYSLGNRGSCASDTKKTMDPNTDKQPLSPSSANAAPPVDPGQTQPWRQWYSLNELDTPELGHNDDKKQQCSGQTQAVTALWRLVFLHLAIPVDTVLLHRKSLLSDEIVSVDAYSSMRELSYFQPNIDRYVAT